MHHLGAIQMDKDTRKTYPLESSCRAFGPSSREDTILWSRGIQPVTCRRSVDSYLRNEETRDGPTPISKGGMRGWNKNWAGVLSDHRGSAQKRRILETFAKRTKKGVA